MRHRPLCSICLMVFLVLSIIIHWGGALVVQGLRPSPLERNVADGGKIQLSGEIYQKETKEDYQILYLKNNSCIYQEQSFQESKIIIYAESKEKLNIGNVVLVSGEISFYEEERNPGNFNQKYYYQKQDIHASVWADSVKVLDTGKSVWKRGLWQFRNRWKEILCEKMGKRDGGILVAMLLGEKGEMDTELKELYQANGIGHILAISGLHLSFIGYGMYRIFRKLTGSYMAGGIAGISFLFCYILMIGLTVSAVRALIMFLFRVGADMAGRHYDGLTALSVAAVIVLLWRPLYLYDGGFWLSFGAVFAVLIILPLFQKMPFQPIWASVSINLLLLPIQLYYFYEFPVYSIFLNLCVIPLMSVVMFLGIMGSVAVYVLESTVFHSAGNMILYGCKGIFWGYEKICEIAVTLPGARVVTGQPEGWQMVVYYIILAGAIVLWKRWMLHQEKGQGKGSSRQGKYCGRERHWAIGIWFMGLMILGNPLKNYGELSITVVDVGQGDGIFIRSPQGNTYLVDGGSNDIKKVGQYRLEPFLKSQGVRKLDYVFVTHGDGDHTSGIEEMLSRGKVGVKIETIVFPCKNVWDENLIELANAALDYGVRVVTIEKGQSVVDGEMKFICLAPADTFLGEVGNAASLVLALSYEGFDMLFTGDVEAEGEVELTEVLEEEYGQTTWEVLKIAHHGSKNSSTEEFLKVVQPQYALISAGVENRYGHPHEETLERLREVGSKVLLTQESGAMEINVDEGRYKIKEYALSRKTL